MESTDNPISLRLVGGHLALDLVNTVEPRIPGAAPERDHLTTPAELLAWATRAGAVEPAEAEGIRRAWRGGAQALAATLAIREALYAVLVGHFSDPARHRSRVGRALAAAPPSAATAMQPARGVHAAGELPAALAAAPPSAATAMQPARGVHAAGELPAALDQLSTRYAAAAARARLVLDERGPGGAALRFGDAAEFAVQDRLAAAAIDLLTTVDAAQLRTCPLEEGGCGWVFLDRSRNHSRRWCAMADCGSRVKAQRLTGRRRAAAR